MRPKIIIISFTVIIGTVLSFYIVGQESKGTNEIDSQVGQKSEPVVQVANRGETKVKLKKRCLIDKIVFLSAYFCQK